MTEAELRARLTAFVESGGFRRTIVMAILLNALLLGADTFSELPASAHRIMLALDHGFLALFLAEIALRLTAYRRSFFNDGWNIFDVLVIGVSLAPAFGPLRVLRVLRVLRLLRILVVVRPLQRVVMALIRAVPGVMAVVGVLAVVFYIMAVLCTDLFGVDHPRLFGDLFDSMRTLFQLMIYDDWGNITSEVGETHVWAPVLFAFFTIVSAFAILNLFIAVMVDALRLEHDRLADVGIDRLEETQAEATRELDELETAVNDLEAKIDALIAALNTRGGDPAP